MTSIGCLSQLAALSTLSVPKRRIGSAGLICWNQALQVIDNQPACDGRVCWVTTLGPVSCGWRWADNAHSTMRGFWGCGWSHRAVSLRGGCEPLSRQVMTDTCVGAPARKNGSDRREFHKGTISKVWAGCRETIAGSSVPGAGKPEGDAPAATRTQRQRRFPKLLPSVGWGVGLCLWWLFRARAGG